MGSRLLKPAILGLFVGIVGIIAGLLPLSLSLDENVGLDFLFKLRGGRQAASDVVVVSIDRESSENLNLPDNPDKWPRSIHARLVENLIREGAQVIAFDVHFLENRSAVDDNLFAKAINNARNVVLCEPLVAKEVSASGEGSSFADVHSIVKVVKPLALFADPAVATAPFPLPRIPFKVSQYWTFQTSAGDAPTLPVVVFQLFALQVYEPFIHLLEKVSPDQARKLPRDQEALIKTRDVKGVIRDIREIFERDPSIGERMLNESGRSNTLSPDSKKNQMLHSLIKMYQGPGSRYINYYGPPRTVPTLPYYQALQLRNGVVGDKKVDVKGKAVFVGLSEVLLAERKDSFYTVFSQANGIFIGGVEIAATAFSNLMEDRPLKSLSTSSFILVILLWGILLGVICRVLPMVFSALSVIGLSVLYLIAAKYQFRITDSWYPTIVPLLFQAPLAFVGAVVWNYIDTNKERQNIKQALGYYLPKDVVNDLARNIAQIKTGGQVVYGICLFTDVADYTSLAETMDPAELGRLMNRYYETMFRPIKQHGGFVSGVIGDSMLALWVSAGSEASLRNKACLAAVDIRKALKQLGQSTETVKLKIRIGLHCGYILLGHIGALDHYEYTPMGDIVNTASRIEGLNKHLGTGILVSEEIIRQLDGLLIRELGQFRMAGKSKPIGVYEIVARTEESNGKLRDACAIFAEGLNAYRRKSWDEAIEKFHQSIEKSGEDGPAHFYITLCESYKRNPPGEPWNEVVHIDRK